MDIREFCGALSTDLAGWRSMLYGIISHVETLPELDRRYFAPDVSALRAMIDEIETDVRKISKECPV